MKKQFERKGYVILRNFFTDEELTAVEKAIAQLYALQAYKIQEYRNQMNRHYLQYESYEDICEIYSMMEPHDKEALYQVHSMLMESFYVRSFVLNEKLLDIASDLLNVAKDILLFNGMGLFVNKPGSNRLLYKWHTAEHGYPKRRSCLSVWFPLFIDKTVENGAMWVAESTHKSEFPFVEYTGYSTKDRGKGNQLTQREIPDYLIKEYKKVPMTAKRGDVVLFDHRLVHTSRENISDDISFAGVIKVWSTNKDLTLAGNIAVTPYSGKDFGRSQLIIDEE